MSANRFSSREISKPKRELTPKEREQRRAAGRARARQFTPEHQARAGRALVKKRGRRYMSQLGKQGYAVAVARHPDLARRGGIASARKQNLCQLDAGYYPNQSRQMWGYCEVIGCYNRLPAEGEALCEQHRAEKDAGIVQIQGRMTS
jgi:hypothetical protein